MNNKEKVFKQMLYEVKQDNITVHLMLFNATIAKGIPKKLEYNDIKGITSSQIPN